MGVEHGTEQHDDLALAAGQEGALFAHGLVHLLAEDTKDVVELEGFQEGVDTGVGEGRVGVAVDDVFP